MLMVALGLLGLCAFSAAPQSGPELLAQPCRAKQVLAGTVVTDPQTGQERLVLTNMNESTGMELVFVDVKRNQGSVYHAPAGQGSWALLQAPGDRLIIGTYYDGQFMVFDLKQRKFIANAGVPGETYVWNLYTSPLCQDIFSRGLS